MAAATGIDVRRVDLAVFCLGAGIAGLAVLLRECILRGSPTPTNVAMIFGVFLVTPELRKRIRDALFLPAYKGASSGA